MQICTRDTLSAFQASILSKIFTLDNFSHKIDRGGVLAVHCQPALPYHIDYQLHHVRIHNPSSTRLLRLNRLNASAFDVPSGIPRALGTSQPLEPAYIISPSRPDCKPTARFQQQSSLCVPRASTFPECCPQYRTPLTVGC